MSEAATDTGPAEPQRSEGTQELQQQQALLKAGALQTAILTSANFSIIATEVPATLATLSTSMPPMSISLMATWRRL